MCRRPSMYDIPRFQKEWFQLLRNAYPQIDRALSDDGDLSQEAESVLDDALKRFKSMFVTTEEAKTFSPERVIPDSNDTVDRLADSMLDISDPETAIRG